MLMISLFNSSEFSIDYLLDFDMLPFSLLGEMPAGPVVDMVVFFINFGVPVINDWKLDPILPRIFGFILDNLRCIINGLLSF